MAADDGESGRRRRRRGAGVGGDRGFGESIAPDAPQPTDDGLAVVAEIGGDLEAPVVATESFEGRAPGAEGDRGGRRSRRSRNGRNRFPPRAPDGSFGDDAVAEPGLSGVLEPVSLTGAAPAAGTEGAFAAASPAEPEAFAWTYEPSQAREERAAPPTQPSVEETAIAVAAAGVAAPTATVAERFEASEVTLAPRSEDETATPAPSAANAESETEAAPSAAEPVDGTPRPRRTGWWQRARASIVGD